MLIFGNSFPKFSNGISEEQSALNINIHLRKILNTYIHISFVFASYALASWHYPLIMTLEPMFLVGIGSCSFSSLLELVSELLLSTAGVWSAAPCPAPPSLQAPRSFISYLCASEWRMYCPYSLFISVISSTLKQSQSIIQSLKYFTDHS